MATSTSPIFRPLPAFHPSHHHSKHSYSYTTDALPARTALELESRDMYTDTQFTMPYHYRKTARQYGVAHLQTVEEAHSRIYFLPISPIAQQRAQCDHGLDILRELQSERTRRRSRKQTIKFYWRRMKTSLKKVVRTTSNILCC